METDRKIAVFIDADNTQLSKLDEILGEISTHGRIVVKRAYGNWKKAVLAGWEKEIKRLGINARQQFDYVSGKNATDMALVIEAMDLLSSGNFQSFAIVSSDSDFTPLAIRLHESGAHVLGIGKGTTPDSFRNACDDFVLIENLNALPREDGDETGKPDVVRSSGNIRSRIVPDYIHALIRKGCDTYSDGSEWADLAAVASYLKRARPDFSPMNFGFPKLLNLLESFPGRYEIRRTDTPTRLPILRCLD